ncbi:hypothetical protein ACWGIA_34505 [Streptomyces bobili]
MIAMTFVLFTEGRFGRAVAKRLEAQVPDLRVLPLVGASAAPDALDDLLSEASFTAVALWRRYPRELQLLDAACYRQQIGWTSAVLEDSRLRCGPLIMPPLGPCHDCYVARQACHATAPERDSALDSAYADSPSHGSQGFTPSTVGMAAAALLLDRAEASPPGRLRLIDLLGCTVTETRVLKVHGCERCSVPRPPGERYVRDLIDQLEGRSS